MFDLVKQGVNKKTKKIISFSPNDWVMVPEGMVIQLKREGPHAPKNMDLRRCIKVVGDISKRLDNVLYYAQEKEKDIDFINSTKGRIELESMLN